MSAVQHFSMIELCPPLPTAAVGILAYLHNHPEHEQNQLIETACHGRPGGDFNSPRIPCPTGERFKVRRMFVDSTACDGCVKTAHEETILAAHREQWVELCPSEIRKTDMKHPDFPRAQYELTKGFTGKSSLLFLGGSGLGKTRLAFLLLKRCLHFHGKSVGVMWDEDLQDTKSGFKSRTDHLEKWGRFDLLLIDDGLLSGGRDEKITSFLKSLLDFIHRHSRHVIITSQLTGDDYVEELRKFDGSRGANSTEADNARVGAVLRRIREMCGQPIIFHGKPDADSTGGKNAGDGSLPF